MQMQASIISIEKRITRTSFFALSFQKRNTNGLIVIKNTLSDKYQATELKPKYTDDLGIHACVNVMLQNKESQVFMSIDKSSFKLNGTATNNVNM